MEMGREREWETCAHSAPASFLSVSPSGCRRAASFPFFGETTLQPSNLKVRSQSESEGLNRSRRSPVKIEPLYKRGTTSTIDENGEGSDCDSKHSSSSSECDVDDVEIDIECAGKLEDLILELPEKRRKNVRFADDCGQDLFCVKIATEPSDCPPLLSPSVLRRYRGDSFDEETPQVRHPVWNLQFKQPAAEYVRFRERLEKDKISLENVIVKCDTYQVLGTVKVANISFEKSVFVRFTMNGWQSYMDKPAIYQPSTSKVYDTFKFELDLPHSFERIDNIEFCLCFKANSDEHWDSNGGANYKLQREEPVLPGEQKKAPLFGRSKFLDSDDAYKMDRSDWGSFASWKSLSTDRIYW